MRKMLRMLTAAMVCGFLLIPYGVWADSVSPDTFSATLKVGENVTITKTVTVTTAPSETAPVDVFFLADTTGSMGEVINAVRASASSILASTAGLGDVQFAVGEYKDFPVPGSWWPDPYAYRLNQNFTSDTAAIGAGINLWNADGGEDWPEANLYALNEVTEAGWREGSTRILVWFGDAPGHDPSGGVTEASVTAALISKNIAVEAIDVGGTYWGYDPLDGYGQASRIASATGGHFYDGINSGSIVGTITNAIKTVIDEYNTVSLDLSDVPDGVSVSVAPAAYTGTWKRDETHTFDFEVTFTGDKAGTYDFGIGALVDGGLVATELDHIKVDPVPEPATILLLGSGLIGIVGARRRKTRQ